MQFRNEQDILEPFLRHHSPLFDAIFVLNNGSSDRSADIVAHLTHELPNIIPIDVPTRENQLARNIAHVFRMAQSAFFADFVFFLDCDEFIHAGSRAELDAKIAAIPIGQGGRMAWRSYIPDPALDEQIIADPIARLTLRRKAEVARWTTTKMFVRLGGTCDPAIAPEQGNHKIRTGLNFRFRAKLLSDLFLLHLPLRSKAQARAKGMVGWASYQARADQTLGGGQHWKKLVDQFAAQAAPMTNMDLAETAMRYGTRTPIGSFATNSIADDHGLPRLRRYSDGSYGDPEALIRAALDPVPMRSQTFALPPAPDGQAVDLDAPPLQYLMARLAPKSVLEVALDQTGYGLLAAFFGANHVESLAPQDQLWRAAPVQHPYDGAGFDLGRRFDLVICLGAQAAGMAAAASHAVGAIVTTSPGLGPADLGRFDPAALQICLSEWAALGWSADLTMTLAARACATKSSLHRGLLVLRPGPPDPATNEKLLRIAAFAHHPYPQPPQLRLCAFTEPFPDLDQGYGLRLP